MKVDSIGHDFEKKCGVCQEEIHSLIARFHEVPIFLGCASRPKSDDRFLSYEIHQCQRCGLITTNADLSNESYDELHSEAIGDIWERHHNRFADFVCQRIHDDISANTFLEIGPSSNPITKAVGQGSKEVLYLDMLKEVPFELKLHEKYIRGQFPKEAPDKKFHVIIASHVFEHAGDPERFMEGVLDRLEENGDFLISIPNFRHWITHKFWNAITPEHNTYFVEDHLRFLAANAGFRVEVEYFENHSLFACFNKNESVEQIAVGGHLEEDRKMILDWIGFLKDSISIAEQKLTELLSQRNPDAILIAGASHLSQYPILMSPLLKEKVTAVIDNSDFKQGKRLYGTSVVVTKFDAVADAKQPVVIIFSSPYQEEMRDQVLALNPEASIIMSSKDNK